MGNYSNKVKYCNMISLSFDIQKCLSVVIEINDFDYDIALYKKQ